MTVWRDGEEYRQSYACGKPVTALMRVKLADELSSRQGTCIRFWPDKEGFFFLLVFFLKQSDEIL